MHGKHGVTQVLILPGIVGSRRRQLGIASTGTRILAPEIQTVELDVGNANSYSHVRGDPAVRKREIVVGIQLQGLRPQAVHGGLALAGVVARGIRQDLRAVEVGDVGKFLVNVVFAPVRRQFQAHIAQHAAYGKLEHAAAVRIQVIKPSIPVDGSPVAAIPTRVTERVPVPARLVHIGHPVGADTGTHVPARTLRIPGHPRRAQQDTQPQQNRAA